MAYVSAIQDWPPNSEKAKRLRSNRRWALPEEFHYTRWTGERTIAQIERAKEENKPFFIWSSFHDPHPPYIVPAPWADMYDPADMVPGRLTEGEHDRNTLHFRKTQENDAAFWQEAAGGEVIHGGRSHLHDIGELKKDIVCYYGMVSFVDRKTGRMLDALEQSGLAQDTLVVFSTDHGHCLGQHGLIAKAIHHYEDLLRVPFIVRWPGRVPAGGVSDAIQNLVDLAPTFLSAVGLEIPGTMTGINELEAWRGRGPAWTGTIVENHHGTANFHMRTYINQRYKITVYRDGSDGELFDLQEDPAETCNLWRSPEAQNLKCRMLHEFMQATLREEPMRMPRIANA